MSSSLLTRRDIVRGAIGGASLLSAGGLLTACGGKSPSAPAAKPRRGGVLRVGVTGGGATETLDPLVPLLNPDVLRSALLYSHIGEIDGDFRPAGLLAESVTVSGKDATTWDVRLRQGMEFHDGRTVSADDLIATFRRMLNPKTGSAGAVLVPWASAAGMKKLDARTVRFTLSQPVATFDTALYNFVATVVPADFDVKKPIGAGPFKFTSFRAGDRSVFERFDNYFGHAPYVDRVEVVSFKDGTALVNALQSGELEIAMSIGAANARVAKAGGAKLIQTPGMGWVPITMRVDRKPFDDPRVREAFRLIPDREQLVQQVYGSYGSVANDLYGWDDPAYASSLPQRAQDLDRAKSLLQQSGAAGLSIELATTPYIPGQVETCRVFAEQAKGAGVKVDVRETDADTFFAKDYLQAPFSSDVFVNLPYLSNTVQSQLATSPYNSTHVNDAAFKRDFDRALATTSESGRKGILQGMQEIQYRSGAMIIPAKFDNVDATSAKVGGLQSGKRWGYALNGYHLERAYVA